MPDLASWLHGWSRPTFSAPPGVTPVSDAYLRAIAFYLPQYHPIPENDAWWGKGFTEWTSVVRARPLFPGHQQPHLPGELGFYDLRVPEVREQQAELARAYGIAGFCYYHYWFGGKRLLERPFREVLRSQKPDFPFCLCWANENWSRRWDGSEQEILIAQRHSPQDDLALIEELFEAFEDPRYLRVEGKPLFLVYRPMLLPDPQATADRWREACARAGLTDLFLCNVHSFDTVAPQDIGFDAAVEFPPNLKPMRRLNDVIANLDSDFTGVIYEHAPSAPSGPPPYTFFRGLFPTWDNTARRRKSGTVIHGTTPEAYAKWLMEICEYTTRHLPQDRRLIFINAWNEWAEGCHLEPDAGNGRTYLEKTRDVLERFAALSDAGAER